jgi:LysM repeat protein
MRVFFIFIVCFFLCILNSFAQPNESVKKHIVAKGETITQIAQKYKVTPYDIYRMNPDAKNGIQVDATLLIPSSIVGNSSALLIHEVKPKETLFGIAKQYNTTVELLERWNPDVKENGLKVGQTIYVSGKASEVQKTKIQDTSTFNHEVQVKETLYSIAKQYEVSVDDLILWNPSTKEGLSIGQKIIIKNGNLKSTSTDTTPELKKVSKSNYLEYVVKPKETLFSISKLFSISQDELLTLNPGLKEGVKEGMKLQIPVQRFVSSGKTKEIKDLTKSLVQKDKKEIVLLLPFNTSNIESDTTLTTQARLKRDGFLNLTLDFYSGALMAIDSAKRLGLNLNVKILDSQETKKGSSVSSIVQNQNLAKADAVIGPFYPQYVEKTAELLSTSNVPVISPLREITSTTDNVYQSMPPNDFVKNEMFSFIRSKNGNMIAFVDSKKSAAKQFIVDNHKDIYLAPLNEKGAPVWDSILTKLSKEKVNFFILETASTGMIFNALNQCNNAKSAGYSTELVVLDINNTFETDEVFPRILRQQIIFPSLTRYQDTPQSLNFAIQYKKKNNVYPNQYAVRGFDVVFDTMMRLFQKEDFETTIQTYASEGVENKFDYEKNSSGYSNKGIYIMQYVDDFNVKLID